jgi:hypothetical protein
MAMRRYHRQTSVRCPQCAFPLNRWDHGEWICVECSRFVPVHGADVTLADGTEMAGGPFPLRTAAEVWRLLYWRD